VRGKVFPVGGDVVGCRASSVWLLIRLGEIRSILRGRRKWMIINPSSAVRFGWGLRGPARRMRGEQCYSSWLAGG